MEKRSNPPRGIRQPVRKRISKIDHFSQSLKNSNKYYCPKCPRILPKMVHHGRNCQDILNVPLGNTSGAPFWCILNFTGWEHCDHTTQYITQEISNEPLGNTRGTFFGKIQGVPMVFPFGTSQSHDLVHCECTDHFLSLSHSGTS